MATPSPSTQHTSTPRSTISRTLNQLLTMFQAVSFWATVVLPLVLTVAVATGAIAAAPKLVSELIPVTVACALCSRSYSPRL